MTFSVLCYLCAAICGLTDITGISLRERRTPVFSYIFFCTFMIAVGSFEVSPCREAIINPAVVLGPFLYMLIDRSTLTVRQSALVPLASFLITAGLLRLEINGSIAVLLYAMLCVLSAFVMKNPFFAALIIPVLSKIVICVMELISDGYTFLELSDEVIGAMQGVGVLTASLTHAAKLSVIKLLRRKPVRE